MRLEAVSLALGVGGVGGSVGQGWSYLSLEMPDYRQANEIRCPPGAIKFQDIDLNSTTYLVGPCNRQTTLATLPTPHGLAFSLKMLESLNRHRIDMGCREPDSKLKGLLPMGPLWSIQLHKLL